MILGAEVIIVVPWEHTRVGELSCGCFSWPGCSVKEWQCGAIGMSTAKCR